MMKILTLILSSLFLSLPQYLSDQAGWQNLLLGENLNNWEVLGGEADYTVEGGVIIGEAVMNSPNSFLNTTQEYGDFILEFKVYLDSQLNSGMQIRSNSDPSHQNGRVDGYQVEIDPSARAWSGGIYDEARRGWWLHIGGEGLEKEIEILGLEKSIFCQAHRAGSIETARRYGKRKFGTIDKYYENYHKILCPPDESSTLLYLSINKYPSNPEINSEIENLKKLSKKKRDMVFNRPVHDDLFGSRTVMDLVIEGINRSEDSENEGALARYTELKALLEEAGAKKFEELSDEEIEYFDSFTENN